LGGRENIKAEEKPQDGGNASQVAPRGCTGLSGPPGLLIRGGGMSDLTKAEVSDIKILRDWCSRLEAEIQQHTNQINEAQQHFAMAKSKLDRLNAFLDVIDEPQCVEKIPIADTAAAILDRLKMPAHYKDLAAMFRHDGITLPGINPAANLLTNITRDDRFVRIKRGIYALAAWKLPKKD